MNTLKLSSYFYKILVFIFRHKKLKNGAQTLANQRYQGVFEKTPGNFSVGG